jgi:hypothetical protein
MLVRTALMDVQSAQEAFALNAMRDICSMELAKILAQQITLWREMSVFHVMMDAWGVLTMGLRTVGAVILYSSWFH